MLKIFLEGSIYVIDLLIMKLIIFFVFGLILGEFINFNFFEVCFNGIL